MLILLIYLSSIGASESEKDLWVFTIFLTKKSHGQSFKLIIQFIY